jgi:type IV pilus assembly protein PilO
MTIGGDFIPTGDGIDSGVSYPKLFGVTLTPTVGGILAALVGVGFAGWLVMNIVMPAWQRNQELSQDITSKEAQLVNQGEFQQQIAAAKAKLQEAQQLQADVLNLFATEQSLDTLLLDVNERVQSVNVGIRDPNLRATLSKFELDPALSAVIADDSLGTAVANRLKRRVYNVEIQGTYPQTQSIIRNIERLQPLLVVNNFRSELMPDTQVLLLDAQGRVVRNQPSTRITTSFQLSALVPNAPTPAASPQPSPPAQASPSP